ncbi:MAG: ribonuclease P protein component [Flavobacteriales bacterium]|nr:ribonuclease P protein component [Flavobacteriales bacterium]MCB9166897.1 ribonuclease P protein component [Flavobacteriales bacterium]
MESARPSSTPPRGRATFRKHERLSGRKIIQQVVREGAVVHRPPFRVSGLIVEDENMAPLRIAFAVPKRYLPRAVDRNRMKRLMREVWRRNKHAHVERFRPGVRRCALLVAFQGRSTVPFPMVESKMIEALDRWMKEHG